MVFSPGCVGVGVADDSIIRQLQGHVRRRFLEGRGTGDL